MTKEIMLAVTEFLLIGLYGIATVFFLVSMSSYEDSFLNSMLVAIYFLLSSIYIRITKWEVYNRKS